MPIGNIYLSEYQVGEVTFPSTLIDTSAVGDHVDTLDVVADAAVSSATSPELSEIEIAFTRLDSKVESSGQPVELVQGWPGGKIFDVQPATYVHEVELPIILSPSPADSGFRIRTNEISFWMAWVKYMMSTIDRASILGRECSAVVERASCRVTADGIKLLLRIVSNYPLNWTVRLSSGQTIIGRQASCYDTFVAVEDYATGIDPSSYKGVGLEDRWGITSLDMDASTSRETITTSRSGLATNPSDDWMIPDQINAKMVSYLGNIDVFGLVQGWIQWYNWDVSSQSSRVFRLGTEATDPGSSVFTDAMKTGGLGIYVGGYNRTTDSLMGIPLLMLPTGTLVGTAGIRAGRGPLSITREFYGAITDTPKQGTRRPVSTL